MDRKLRAIVFTQLVFAVVGAVSIIIAPYFSKKEEVAPVAAPYDPCWDEEPTSPKWNLASCGNKPGGCWLKKQNAEGTKLQDYHFDVPRFGQICYIESQLPPPTEVQSSYGPGTMPPPAMRQRGRLIRP